MTWGYLPWDSSMMTLIDMLIEFGLRDINFKNWLNLGSLP